MFEIGVITTTHGIKGELKIKSFSDFERFKKGEKMFIMYNNERIDLTIEQARPHKTIIIIKFKEYNNINEVLNYRALSVYSDTRGKLQSDEYYFDHLIGTTAYTDEGILIGEVINVIELPHGHILEVKNDAKKILIPLEKEFVISVTDDKIIIKPIEGLL